MSGGLEAAADAATGAIVGRAVEPGHGEAAEAADHGVCLNCGAALKGPYCSACGQAAHVHRTLGGIGHEIAHGVFHFEGKIWRTLPMLAWRPGELTRRYVHGERARFVSPLALFLFTVFLMFAVISSLFGHLDDMQGGYGPAIDVRGKSVAQIDAEIAQQKALLADVKAQKQSLDAAGRPAYAAERRRDQINGEIADLLRAKAFLGATAGKGNTFVTGWKKLDEGLVKANRDPGLLLYKLQASAYKYSWALIPLSTPFLWLLFFWRRRFKLYDHAVFVTYSLSFMMLLVIVLSLAGAAGTPAAITALAAIFVPPVHIYRQLRGAYEIGWKGAAIRTLALGIFGGVVLTLFVALLLVLGLMG